MDVGGSPLGCYPNACGKLCMVDSRLPGAAQPSVGQGPRRPYAGCVRVVSIAPLLRVGVSLA